MATEGGEAAAPVATASDVVETVDDTAKARIIKQINFYFGDSNLPKDKFLQKKVAENPDGWIELAVIASFTRMRENLPSKSVATLAAIMKSNEDICEVSEDNTMIRRSPAKPLPAESTYAKKTCYTKGWDLKETTIDSIEEYFTKKSYKVVSVRLRRAPATKEFKGSAFVEFNDVEEATKCAGDTHELGENKLLIEMKQAYHARKTAERVAKRKQKQASGNNGAKAEAAEIEEYESGCVMKFEGVPDTTSREDLKELLNAIKTVKWVDFSRGDTSGEIRFEEGGAAAIVKEKLDTDKTEINGKVPTWTVLEGDEEKAYWKKVAEAKLARRQNSRGGRGRGGHRRGGGRGGRGGGRGGYGKRKRDDGDSGDSAKKAKSD